MKIVCDAHIPFLRGVLEPYAEVAYIPGQDISADDVRDADALMVRTRTRCDKALLEGSKVRFIATATIGYDHIDTAWCESNGIAWTNAPGCNSWSVQQYMGSLLVCLSRHFGFAPREKTLGIIGAGNVGSKVARLAALLGFRVLLCDPPRARKEGAGGFVTIDEIVAQCDIISCHVPLTRQGDDATYHLFDSSRIAALRPDQILINTSRGEVVDGQALKEALKSKSILTAALDVWENEPRIDPELLGLLFIGTPHIAGYSQDGKANGTMICIQTMAKYLDLPLADWEVSDIPQPDEPAELTLDAESRRPQELLADAILHTYDVRKDAALLLSDVNSFEKLRSSYRIRREFQAFSVMLKNDQTGRCGAFLREMSFNICE